MKHGGFTFVELLVVVGIFALSATGAVLAFRYRAQSSAGHTAAADLVASIVDARSRLISGISPRPCLADTVCDLPIRWVIRLTSNTIEVTAVYADASLPTEVLVGSEVKPVPAGVSFDPGDDIRLELVEGRPRFVDEGGRVIAEQQIVRVTSSGAPSTSIVLDAQTGSAYVSP